MLVGGLEDNVLVALVWSPTLAPVLAEKIQVSDFSTPTYRRIAEVALEYIAQYGTAGRSIFATSSNGTSAVVMAGSWPSCSTRASSGCSMNCKSNLCSINSTGSWRSSG
jgi:hypothetical protein